MSKRAEEATRRIHNRAILEAEKYSNSHGGSITEEVAYGRGFKAGFIEGYETAEKDLALTIEDLELIHTFLYAVKNNKHGAFTFTRLTDEQYAEVFKRFKETKDGNDTVYP